MDLVLDLLAATCDGLCIFQDHLLAPYVLYCLRLWLLLEHVFLDELLREGELVRVLFVLLV